MSIRHHQNMCQLPVLPWQKKIPSMYRSKELIISVLSDETLSGDILPFQTIYTGKTSHSLPTPEFPEGFLLGFNESH